MKLRLTGITPLMLHNIRLADPDDPVVRQISELTAKKKSMTEADRLQVAWLKFVGGLYHDGQNEALPPRHAYLREHDRRPAGKPATGRTWKPG